MPSLVYIHGFLSSSQSKKAQATHQWLNAQHPDWHFYCPDLPSSPALTKQALDEFAQTVDPRKTGLIGSSMGGFWATYLCERHGMPAVLINPGVSPYLRFRHLIGKPMQNYYNDEICVLREEDIDILAACDPTELRDTDQYWLMTQTGDDVLDYRLAVERYRGARQTIEEGGSHSFEGYEVWLPEIFEFIQQRLY